MPAEYDKYAVLVVCKLANCVDYNLCYLKICTHITYK
jgi:hypothetical protein